MRVEVARSGGFMGLTLRAEMETAGLPDKVRAAVEEALRGLPYGRRTATAGGPDRFRYEIAVTDHSGRRVGVLDEGQVPEALRRVLDDAISRDA